MIKRYHKLMNKEYLLSVRNGLLATTILFSIYLITVSVVSGWNFMLEQLEKFWYFVITLAVGFGIQVGLYSYLKNAASRQTIPMKVLTVPGTTSTTAMISCCAHYLVNILPILGTVGIITVISQYQVQFFWVGLAFNFAGILYMLSRVIKYTRGI